MRVKSGEQLVILDDMVLDVSQFQFKHPGGKFVIKHNIGRDISKFFYGGYTLEVSAGNKPYTHSNIARKIVNKIQIGSLVKEGPKFNCTVENRRDINNVT